MPTRAKPQPEEEDTDEIIEGTAVDVTPERALATVPPAAIESSLIVGGMVGLARMSDEEFDRNLEALTVLRARVDKVKKGLMKEGIDYGVIPGTGKPALLKPGTETLLRTFGLADSYLIERFLGDGETTPDYEIIAHARIHIGSTDGPVVAEGIGTANTFETKHRYRGGAARDCPNCGKANVIHSKPPRTGWWCGTRDGGCGASFDEDDPKIKGQPDPGKAENPDPWDLANTVTKMAKKRALVDGILTATGTSGIFTQDEDAPGHKGSGPPPTGGTPTGTAQTPSGAPRAESGGLQAVVQSAPEGVHMVKPTSEISKRYLTGEGPFAKLEVKTKVGNSNHLLMLFGDLAGAVEVLQLQQGETVSVEGGTVEFYKWSEDDSKPKQKQVWGATEVRVQRDGEWISATAAKPALPMDGGEEPPKEAITPANSTPAAMTGTDGDIATLQIELSEPISFGLSSGRRLAVIRGGEIETGEVVQAVLIEEDESVAGEVKAQLGSSDDPFLRPGDRATILGTWAKGWLKITGIGKVAK